MQEWLHLGKPEHKLNHRLSQEISTAIDRFYFNHYCRIFQSGAFARATASMCVINFPVNILILTIPSPMVNMAGM